MKKKKRIADVYWVYAQQIINSILAFVSIPIILSYLGSNKFGIYTLIFTVLTYLNLINFGLPVTLRSYIASSFSEEVRIKIIKVVTKYLIIAALLCLILLLIIFSSGQNLSVVLGSIAPQFIGETNLAILFALIFFLVALPFSSYIDGLSSINKISLGKKYEITSQILSFLSILVVVYYDFELYAFFLFWGLLCLSISIIGYSHFVYLIKRLSEK